MEDQLAKARAALRAKRLVQENVLHDESSAAATELPATSSVNNDSFALLDPLQETNTDPLTRIVTKVASYSSTPASKDSMTSASTTVDAVVPKLPFRCSPHTVRRPQRYAT